jgi:glycosyltransferase involved in cell wall biosynthesis
VTIVQAGHDVYGSRGMLAGRVESVDVPGTFRSSSPRTWYRLLHRLAPDAVVLFKGSIDNRALRFDLACVALGVRYVTVEAHLPPLLVPLARGRSLRGWIGARVRFARQRVAAWLHSRAPTHIIANSVAVRDRLVKQYGFRPGIAVIPIGIDAKVFAPSESLRLAQRETWGIDANDVVLGAVGRIDSGKRLDWAVRALASHVSSGNQPPAWLILGGEGNAREALTALARRLGVAERVKFLGWVPSSRDVIAALDIFVLPSEAEGFGIALIESMAAGCVCVATDSGGPREILTDASLGWLVARDDEPAFAAAVGKAIAMAPSERAQIGNKARASVLDRFDQELLDDQLLDEILG